MALTVDSFSYLVKDIFETIGYYRDVFAVVGTLSVAHRSLHVLWHTYKAVKVHGLSKMRRPDLVGRYGQWAVVTGSTHGIGKALAFELASNGLNIVIISLGKEECAAVAESIESQFKVKTQIIPIDFDHGRHIYTTIKEGLKNKDIGILVNNVGVMYDSPQYFLEVPEEKLWQIVHVNVAAATMMTHTILPGMVKRGRGAVIIMSSGACMKPTPQMTVYASTKAYLSYFAKSLAYEYKDKGITVQCLTPFYVATRMTRYSETLSNPSLWIPSASVYARQALLTLGMSERTAGYWPHTIQMWITNLIPDWLWMWGALRLNNALKRQAQYRKRHRSRSPKEHNSNHATPKKSGTETDLSSAAT